MLKTNKDWFNDPDFWNNFAPIMFDDAHWAEVDAVADGVTCLSCFDLINKKEIINHGVKGVTRRKIKNSNKNLRVTPCPPRLNSSPKLLDICCGPGRLSTEFARRGFSVTGIDITESYLQTAREDAAAENLKIEYINIDAREYKKTEYFDVAVNLYNSLGFFDDQNDDLRLVQNAYESLKPGGCFIIETFGKELAVRDFTEGDWFERAGGKVLTRYKVIDSWNSLQNTWIFIKNGKDVEKTFTQRLYAATELRALLFKAGFSSVEIYGNWDMGEYDIDADRLIVVGRKGSASNYANFLHFL